MVMQQCVRAETRNIHVLENLHNEPLHTIYRPTSRPEHRHLPRFAIHGSLQINVFNRSSCLLRGANSIKLGGIEQVTAPRNINLRSCIIALFCFDRLNCLC